jgi:hypothetical protein
MTTDDKCHCGRRAEFGYRNKESGAMTWCCAAHRLGQYYADARKGDSGNPSSFVWEGWHARGR